MVRRCEVCGNGATRGMVWLSSSRRKLAHQQFVSVGIKHNQGRESANTQLETSEPKKKKAKRKTVKQKKNTTHVSIVTALLGTVRMRLTERPL